MAGDKNNVGSDLSSGIFTLDVSTDTVYADCAAAFLFGLNPVEAALGLPIQRFIDRVHQDDRPMLAKEIAHAITTSAPYQMEYRVCATSKVWVEVMAFGHCFRTSGGEPNHFSGIIYPVPVDNGARDALWHLLTAYQILSHEGTPERAKVVLDALKTLTNPGDNPLEIARLYH